MEFKSCVNCIHRDVCKYVDVKISVGTRVKDTLHECKSFEEKIDHVSRIKK